MTEHVMRGRPAPVEGQNRTGPLFNEPMRVETVRPRGPYEWVVGLLGLRSEQFRSVALTSADLNAVTVLEIACSFDGDGKLLLGFQAYSPGFVYKFDLHFELSISRVDPLPHQLEAVYEYLLKLARVKADKLADPQDNEYTAEDVFWVPKEVRWGYIQGKAKETTIGKVIDHAVVAVEKDSPSLKGVSPKDYARSALDKQRAA